MSRTPWNLSGLVWAKIASGWTDRISPALMLNASPTCFRSTLSGSWQNRVTPTTFSLRPMSNAIAVRAGEKVTIRRALPGAPGAGAFFSQPASITPAARMQCKARFIRVPDRGYQVEGRW